MALNCPFSSSIKHASQFTSLDWALLRPSYAEHVEKLWDNVFCDKKIPHPNTRQSTPICESIASVIREITEDGGIPFSVIMESEVMYGKRSVFYWLKYCHLSLPTAVLTTSSTVVSDIHDCMQTDSDVRCNHLCNVKYYEGLEQSSGYKEDIYCLEDFFHLLHSTSSTHLDISSSHLTYIPSLLYFFINDNTPPSFRSMLFNSTYYEMEQVLYSIHNIGLNSDLLSVKYIEYTILRAHESTSNLSCNDNRANTREVAFNASAEILYQNAPLTTGLVSETIVYVYVVIYDFHLPIARKFVEHMKTDCELNTCTLYLKYVFVPVKDYDRGVVESFTDYMTYCGYDDNESRTIDHAHCRDNVVYDYLHATPEMFSAYLAVRSLLDDIQTELDVAYVLIGLTSLFSFPQPSIGCRVGALTWPDDGCQGLERLLKVAEYGKKGDLVLPARIVIPTGQNKDTIGAVMGQSAELQLFISKIMTCLSSSSPCDNDEGCREDVWSELQKHALIKTDHNQIFLLEEASKLMHLLHQTLTGDVGNNHNEEMSEVYYLLSLEMAEATRTVYDRIIQPFFAPKEKYHKNHLYSMALEKYEQFISPDMLHLIQETFESDTYCPPPTQMTISYLVQVSKVYMETTKWFPSSFLLLTSAEFTYKCADPSLDKELIYLNIARFLAVMIRYTPNANHLTPMEDYLAVNALLQYSKDYLLPYINHEELSLAVFALHAMVSFECEDIFTARRLYYTSLAKQSKPAPGNYLGILERRERINTSKGIMGKVHYVTYASDVTEGLRILLKSASYAGIPMQILGLNQPFRDFGDRIKAYVNYLFNSPDLNEEDLVLFVDAYDVILFSAVRQIASLMKKKTERPIVLCAEGGIFPEFLSSQFHRKTNRAQQDASMKFVNAGCILGKVWALRLLFTFELKYSQSMADDQLLLIRHFITHPDLYYLDNEQYFTITNYKTTFLSLPKGRTLTISPELGLLISRGNDSSAARNIGIFHGNNMNSGILYHLLAQQYDKAVEVYIDNVSSLSSVDNKTNKSTRIREIWHRVDSLLKS